MYCSSLLFILTFLWLHFIHQAIFSFAIHYLINVIFPVRPQLSSVSILCAVFSKALWRRGVVVITTAQLHSTKPELRFCAGSNPARGVSEIRDGEDL